MGAARFQGDASGERVRAVGMGGSDTHARIFQCLLFAWLSIRTPLC